MLGFLLLLMWDGIIGILAGAITGIITVAVCIGNERVGMQTGKLFFAVGVVYTTYQNKKARDYHYSFNSNLRGPDYHELMIIGECVKFLCAAIVFYLCICVYRALKRASNYCRRRWNRPAN